MAILVDWCDHLGTQCKTLEACLFDQICRRGSLIDQQETWDSELGKAFAEGAGRGVGIQHRWWGAPGNVCAGDYLWCRKHSMGRVGGGHHQILK